MNFKAWLKNFYYKHQDIIFHGIILLTLLSILLAILTYLIAGRKITLDFHCLKQQIFIGEFNDKNEIWKRSLDETQNPCDNFYKFSCGNFCPGSFLEKKVKALETCLYNAITEDFATNSSAVQKMRQYNDKYFEQATLNEKMPISQLIDDIKSFGSCPLFDPNWSSTNLNLNLTQTVHRILELTGQNPLFNMYAWKTPDASFMFTVNAYTPNNFYFENLKSDGDNSTLENSIRGKFEYVIREGNLSAQNKDHLKSVAKQIKDMHFHFYNLAKNAGYYKSAKKEWDKYGHFLSESVSSYMEKIQFDELDKLLPVIGGKQFFMKNAIVLPEVEEYFSKNPLIYVGNKTLFIELNKYFEEMDKSLMANYLCYRYFDYNMYDLDVSLKDLRPIDKSNEEKMNTNSLTLNQFNLVIDYLYVDKCADKKAFDEIRKKFDQVRSSAEQILLESKWLSDEKTREKALLKLKTIKSVIGVHEKALNATLLDQFYEPLTYSANDSLRQMNFKNAFFDKQVNLKYLLEPEKYFEMCNYRANINNAYYYTAYNTIFIPAGRLIPPNFNSKMVDLYNFATLGSTMGHEIFHSLSLLGISFDEKGRFSKWLDGNSSNAYYQVNDCLVKQFNDIWDTTASRYLNGIKTVNEDFADLLGLKAAFHAYKTYGKEEHVEGYEHYTSDQSFFISSALQWCTKYSPDIKSQLIDIDVHSTNDHRVNEVLKNMPEFAKAFNCPIGSPMNPEKKCLDLN